MNSQVKVPKGDEKITIELTVKEAIALTGVRFNGEPQLKRAATKKLMEQLDQTALH
ncbi:hypothetical protein [Marinicrinis lubricantis]|uniref:Uncharacterized protein n=1 Tax=Marinicrinis lubricantis TaxID=2086470 RepID=A0ABW1IQ81_9BACL